MAIGGGEKQGRKRSGDSGLVLLEVAVVVVDVNIVEMKVHPAGKTANKKGMLSSRASVQ